MVTVVTSCSYSKKKHFGLLSGAVSSSDYIVSNGGMISE